MIDPVPVPLPFKANRGQFAGVIAELETLEVGQSASYADMPATLLSHYANRVQGKPATKKFTVRTVPGGSRVWRLS